MNLDRGKVEIASLHPITGARPKVVFLLLYYTYHLYTIKTRVLYCIEVVDIKRLKTAWRASVIQSVSAVFEQKPILWSLLLNINTMAVMISFGFICIIKFLTTFSSACFHYYHIKKYFLWLNFCKIHEHEYIGISFCVEESKLSYSALNGHGEDFGQNFFTF